MPTVTMPRVRPRPEPSAIGGADPQARTTNDPGRRCRSGSSRSAGPHVDRPGAGGRSQVRITRIAGLLPPGGRWRREPSPAPCRSGSSRPDHEHPFYSTDPAAFRARSVLIWSPATTLPRSQGPLHSVTVRVTIQSMSQVRADSACRTCVDDLTASSLRLAGAARHPELRSFCLGVNLGGHTSSRPSVRNAGAVGARWCSIACCEASQIG